MKLDRESISWLLFRRRKNIKVVQGFYAHWNTFVCSNSKFEEYVYIFQESKISNSKVGRFTRINGATISKSLIGSFSSIAPRSIIGGGGDHPLNQVSSHSLFYKADSKKYCNLLLNYNKYPNDLKEVVIGNDVWVGSDAVIKHGVKVGNGAVVASGSVVVKDVPPYAIVGGVPAKVIKYRHSPELVEALENSAWWNWPVEGLKVISEHFDKDIPLTLAKFKLIENEAMLAINATKTEVTE